MERKIALTSAWLLIYVIVTCIMMKHKTYLFLNYEVIHWWELFTTIYIFATFSYVVNLWKQISILITHTFYVIMIAQLYFLVKYCFVQSIQSTTFMQSPVFKIGCFIALLIYLYFVKNLLEKGIKQIPLYKLLLKRVEKSDTTRDDQVLNTMEKLIDFILSIMLFVLAIVFTFGAKSSIALYSTGLGSIFVVMISYSSRHIFKNGISGVVIFAKDILRIGGSITYNGSKGEIKEVELGHIILQKDSGTTIRIPSAGILENGFSNHMKIDRNGFNFQIPIEKNRSKIDQALKSIESLLTKKSKDWNILDNTVEVVVTKIGLNSVTIEASFDTSVMEFDRQVDSSKEKISKDLEQEKKIHKEFIIKIIELNL